jgi:hypothetical protein
MATKRPDLKGLLRRWLAFIRGPIMARFHWEEDVVALERETAEAVKKQPPKRPYKTRGMER